MSKLLAQITKEDITRYASSVVQQRGRAYFKQDRVELTDLDDDQAHLHVEGSHGMVYCIDIDLDFDGGFLADCNCPAFESYNICKHIVASILYLKDLAPTQPVQPSNLTRPKTKASVPRLDNMMWRLRVESTLNQIVHEGQTAKRPKNKPYLVLFSLLKRYEKFNQLNGFKLYLKDLPDSFYNDETNTLLVDMKTLAKYFNSILRGHARFKRIETSTKLPADQCVNLSSTLLSVIRLVKSHFYSYSAVNFMDYIADLLALDTPIFAGTELNPFQNLLEIKTGTVESALNLSYKNGRLQVGPELTVNQETISLNKDISLIDVDQSIIKVGNRLIVGDSSVNSGVLQLAQQIGEIDFSPDEVDFFIDNFLPALLSTVPIRGDAIQWTEIRDVAPQKELYLQEQETYKRSELVASLFFSYNGYKIPYRKEPSDHYVLRDLTQEGKLAFIRLYHDDAFHQEVKDTLSSAKTGLKKGTIQFDADEQFVLRANTDPLDFLLKKVPVLLNEGFEIFGEENLKSVKVNRHKPSLSLNVSSGIDWFDVQAVVKFGDLDISLPDLRKAVRRKEKFVKLSDGSIGQLPEEWLEKYKHLFNLGEQMEEVARFNHHHLTLIDQLLGEADEAHFDKNYEAKLNKLKNFDGIKEVPLPAGFVGELRPYQKAGFDWLHFLQEFQFGGCLADDMGLGKTVQMLVYLASVKETAETVTPSLVVMPRSLLLNWEREAEKFTPNLKTHIHFGPDRVQDTSIFNQHDLILTTYGIMRRDIEMLKDVRFQAVVLDESQAIKNPTTQASKAARLLQAERKLAMSGTPVENSTFELWSQFAFLNPGLLGGIDYFKREFGNPIEKKQDENTAAFLKGMVYPFILRRTKSQVAPELPPRTDEVVYTDMEPAQRRFYDKTRDQYRAQLLGLVEEKGVQGARMKVLEGLLRLRQICNHPKLVNKSFKGDSAKMLLLMERLENLAKPDETGQPHKALVFSQFVQMLKLVEAELKKKGLKYAYLDGSTRKRQAQIDRFQEDTDVPFFLISLKAGGVGLNLTAADYVIHVDPWWNPAVEMQATDRTHRIGQDKPVFVSKLITKNSVEEKILELQQRKQKLVDQLIAADQSFFKNLSAEDIQVLFS